MPDVTFSTDVIVGFPGETDGDFKQTREVMNTVGRAETVEKSAHFAGKPPVSLQLCYILPLPLAIKRLLRYTDIQ